MTTNELLLVKQIFTENPVSHTIAYNKEYFADVYTITVKKSSNSKVKSQYILRVANTPDLHLFEIGIGNKRIYAKTHHTLTSINVNKSFGTISEDAIIGDIIQTCKEKTNQKYEKQLKNIQKFLNAQKSPTKKQK